MCPNASPKGRGFESHSHQHLFCHHCSGHPTRRLRCLPRTVQSPRWPVVMPLWKRGEELWRHVLHAKGVTSPAGRRPSHWLLHPTRTHGLLAPGPGKQPVPVASVSFIRAESALTNSPCPCSINPRSIRRAKGNVPSSEGLQVLSELQDSRCSAFERDRNGVVGQRGFGFDDMGAMVERKGSWEGPSALLASRRARIGRGRWYRARGGRTCRCRSQRSVGSVCIPTIPKSFSPRDPAL